MTNPDVRSRMAWKRLFFLGLGGLLGWWLFSAIHESAKRNDFVAVDLSGKQHIGPDSSIAPFYLNGTNGFNVGREGGGGSDVCCVLLPTTWRPGLSVDLRWAVADWSNENRAEIASGNHKNITFERFRATVPVEKYEAPERVVVHFFYGGKVRVIVGSPGPDELLYAILPSDSHAADIATVGKPVDALFTKEEREAMNQREEERKQKYGGDWK